jgi:uncharacterized phage protein (TIGR02218 family)
VGALSDAGLTERDIIAGRYDGASLVIFEVDWTDPAQRRLLFRGTLGEITRAGGAFRADLRGLSEPLGQSGGRVFGSLCPAVLGDGDCGVDLQQAGFRAVAALVRVEQDGARLVLPMLDSYAPGWFAQGRVRFLTGAAAGLTASVREDRSLAAARQIALWDAPGILPAPGNSVAIEAGCDKRFATCRIKFANTANFRGFPHVPAQEWLLATPRADGTDDGGLLAFQLQTLAGGEHGTTVGELNDNRRFDLGSSFQYGVDGVGTNAVYSWQSEAVLFGDGEHFLNVITSDHAGFYEVENFLRHV